LAWWRFSKIAQTSDGRGRIECIDFVSFVGVYNVLVCQESKTLRRGATMKFESDLISTDC